MIQVAAKEKQLKVLEDIIQHSRERAEYHDGRKNVHWVEIAKALWKIREGKLHPQRTFEMYCRQRWDLGRSRVYQLCHTYEALKDSKSSTIVDKESVARELVNVPEEQREEVVEEASKGGKPTAKKVKDAASKRKPKPKPEHPKDKTGTKIPERAWSIWNRRNELKEKTRPLYELKQWAIDMQGTTDPLYHAHGFDLGNLAKDIAQLIFQIQQLVPDVVCTKCQGLNADCDFCYGRGMISMDLARSATPIEMKKMRDQLTSGNDKSERLSSAGR